MLPGALANPTPGTIVVHFNGKVQVDFSGVWSSVDNHLVTATPRPEIGNATTVPSATSLAGILGNNGIGSVKVQPQNVESFGRIYAGGDGMATNGLRYGALRDARDHCLTNC